MCIVLSLCNQTTLNLGFRKGSAVKSLYAPTKSLFIFMDVLPACLPVGANMLTKLPAGVAETKTCLTTAQTGRTNTVVADGHLHHFLMRHCGTEEKAEMEYNSRGFYAIFHHSYKMYRERK